MGKPLGSAALESSKTRKQADHEENVKSGEGWDVKRAILLPVSLAAVETWELNRLYQVLPVLPGLLLTWPVKVGFPWWEQKRPP